MAAAILPSLRIRPGDFPEVVLMPGDPKRAARIAGYLTDSTTLAHNREFHSYRGNFRGTEIGVLSTGVGSPGAALCSEEAIQAGARVLLRVGTAGSLQDHVQDGHLVVVTGAARCEGTTGWLVPEEWPAVSDHGVVAALGEATRTVHDRCHQGLVVTHDLFYQGLLDLGLNMWSAAGALAVEMECAAIFCVAALRGVRAGAILAIDGDARRASAGGYDPHRDVVGKAVDEEIQVALEAVVSLSEGWG
ncbi:MAG: nucleoside phosphorylase [Candidatus Bipolaricaulota bacterium]